MSSLRLRRPSFFPLYYQHCVTLYKLISRNWNQALSWGNLKMRNTPFNETWSSYWADRWMWAFSLAVRSALASYPYHLEYLGSLMSGILAFTYCFPRSVGAGTAVERVLGLDVVYPEILKHNLILFPNSDIPVWPRSDEKTFYCCPAFVLVGSTPELSFPTTRNNPYLCFSKATSAWDAEPAPREISE